MILIETLPDQSKPKGPVELLRLDWDQRKKHRQRCQTESGTEVALALERGTVLMDGLVVYNAEDRTIVVEAVPQAIIVVQPRTTYDACKISHHLGNWHRSVQLLADGTLIVEDDGPLRRWLSSNEIEYALEQRAYQPNLRADVHVNNLLQVNN